MSRFRRLLIMSFLLFSPVVAAGAEVQYVIDQLVVSVRQAPNDAAPAVDSLRSGQSVTVLGEEGRFLKVQLGDGRQGYVLKQYFTGEPPQRVRLARLEEERDQLKAKLAEAEQQALEKAASTGDLDMQQALEVARQELSAVRAQLEAGGGDEKLAKLQRELEQARGESARLTAEIQAMQEETALSYGVNLIPWFLAGAGVLLLGWLAGKSSRPKRRF